MGRRGSARNGHAHCSGGFSPQSCLQRRRHVLVGHSRESEFRGGGTFSFRTAMDGNGHGRNHHSRKLRLVRRQCRGILRAQREAVLTENIPLFQQTFRYQGPRRHDAAFFSAQVFFFY